MGALMREMNWERTPLGPPESWSPSLKMMTRFLLANRFPLLLWLGPQFCQIYNDAYRPVLGVKVVFADTFAEGLSKAKSERFDLHLIDDYLPDGLELTSYISYGPSM